MLCAPGPLPPQMGFAGPQSEDRKLKQSPSHRCLVEGHDHTPCPVGSSLAAAAQGVVGCLSCKGSLLPHHQLSPHQSTNAISGKLFFIQPQPFLLHGAISSHGFVVAVVASMR